MSRKRVLIMGNVGRDLVRETIERVRPIARRCAEVTESDLEGQRPAPVAEADLALVVGGDGSILKAARLLAPAGVPCVGVNIGRLGFLAGFLVDDLPEALPAILEGAGQHVERLMLSVQIDKRDGHHLYEMALNDVVVSHGSSHRMVGVTVDISHQTVAVYHGDGVLVATPTGSTAYNLASGGPILEARLDAVVITPICPHMLTHRSIVISADVPITLRPTAEQQESTCIIDGQIVVAMVAGDVVHIGKSAHRFRLVENPRRSPFETLREKLHWSHTARYPNGRSPRNAGSADSA
jgi:NAD+ kinase